MSWLRLVWKIWKMRDDQVWVAAKHSVAAVIAHRELQGAAQVESQISYCPECGQIPDGDRRFDHARRVALEILPEQPRRSDLDFALAFYYWKSKL